MTAGQWGPASPAPAEVRGMLHRNLAVELLQKLFKGELATRRHKNVATQTALEQAALLSAEWAVS
jgi:hypothetical protein